jgi:hypothetical protein
MKAHGLIYHSPHPAPLATTVHSLADSGMPAAGGGGRIAVAVAITHRLAELARQHHLPAGKITYTHYSAVLAQE